MLAPRDSRSRDCRRLDGLWRFRFDTGGEGGARRWWERDLPGAREMAVPASYNDLVTEAAEREHVGNVWYQREVRVPATWGRADRAALRRGHPSRRAVGRGHAGRRALRPVTPFEADVTGLARCGELLRVTMRVSSELSMATIPPGVVSRTAAGRQKMRYFHDFFNFSGLHRSVWLCSTPLSYVAGLAVATAYDPGTAAGQVSYHLDVSGPA